MVAINFYIKEYFNLPTHQGQWVPGGVIERYIMSFTNHKGSTVTRTLQKMAQEGNLQKDYKKFQGSPRFVVYKLV